MSQGITYLHSHSAMERDLFLPKHEVIIDEQYRCNFDKARKFVYKGKNYFIVPIALFVKNNGRFLNLKR